MSDAHLVAEAVAGGPGLRLLVWDAPNVDMNLTDLLERKPDPGDRPRFDVLGRWLLGRAEPEEEVEACVFVNVAPAMTHAMRPFVDALRNIGYFVFAKPKVGDSDIDEDLLAHVRRREAEGRLREVLVASSDRFRDFRDSVETISETVPVTVLGFAEYNRAAMESSRIGFVDLESIPGLFERPIPRQSLEMLPVQGRWLRPIRPLSALLASSPAVGDL